MSNNNTTTSEPRLGQPLWFLHNLSTILVDGQESDGRFSLVEVTGAPGDMPPLHIHHEEDETFYVLDGELELHIAGRDPVAVPEGEAAFAPRGVAHVYRVVSAQPSHRLVASNGKIFARLVRDTAVPATSATLPVDPQFDPKEIAAVSARHGIEILGPPGTRP
jgi:quercetin dioxygenase-like cupin family protein